MSFFYKLSPKSRRSLSYPPRRVQSSFTLLAVSTHPYNFLIRSLTDFEGFNKLSFFFNCYLFALFFQFFLTHSKLSFILHCLVRYVHDSVFKMKAAMTPLSQCKQHTTTVSLHLAPPLWKAQETQKDSGIWNNNQRIWHVITSKRMGLEAEVTFTAVTFTK